ncbi:phytanoyl-CoA dioxygenase family protein [Xanthobacter sp. AM11]|uniref:phytanoyl-CoA dioxygenase family protein n=1 Tax=Xanthobacter sp. AM11 TaxID=3380643 RepID=UPI0039BFCE5B
MDKESFNTDGFLIARDMLSDEAIEAIDEHLSRAQLKTKKEFGVRFATQCICGDEDVSNLIMDSVRAIFNCEEAVLHDEVVEVINTYSGAYPIHQDSAYFSDASLSIVVALSQLGDERGGLWAASGSHQKGLLKHDEGEFGPELAGDQSSWGLKPLRLERGDVVLIHPHLVHTMVGNPTTQLARFFSVTIK